MKKISENRKYLFLAIGILLIGVLAIAGSYAYWTWNSSVDKTVVFNTSKALQEYIIYDDGESKFVGDFQISESYLDGIHSTISVKKTEEAANYNLFATIYMDINEIGEYMKVSPALKWAITSGDSSSSGQLLNSGSFYGTSAGETIELKPSFEVTTTEQKFTIWIWIDANENVDENLTGETLDVNVFTQIDQVVVDRFEITSKTARYQIINATAVNSTNNITHYAITTENTEPSSWESIDTSEQAKIYNLEYTASSIGTYYIWFKDSEGNIISNSIEVTTVDTTQPICRWSEFNPDTVADGETSTINLTCVDNESGIVGSTITVDDLTLSNNYVTLSDTITKEKVTNGYKYTFTLTGTENDGTTLLTLPANKITNGIDLGNTISTSVEINIVNTKYLENAEVTLSGTTYTYDGTAKTPTVTVKLDGVTLTSGTNYNVSYSNNVNVGTATVTIEGLGIYEGTITKTFTITSKSLTITAKAQTISYGGSITTGTGQVTVSGLADGHSLSAITLTASTTSATTSGKITPSAATIKDGSGNTVTSNYNITYATGTLTINKVNATCPTVTAYSGTYDGSSHTVTVSGGSGGTIQYRTSSTGTWSSTIPTRTDAGTTTVYVQVLGDSNHNTVDCESKTVTISKKSLTPTVSASNKTYDGTTSASCSVALSGAITGQSPTASVSTCTFADKNVGIGKKVTGSGITLGSDFTTNYSLSTTNATTTANITAKAITITAKAQTINYGGSIATGTGQVTVATLASGDSLTSITLTPSTTSVTTSGKITPSAAKIVDSSSADMTSNYSITYATGTLTINKVNATCPTTSNYSGTYDGSAHGINVSGGSGGTIQYRTSSTGTWSSTKPTITNAGSITTYVQVLGDANHNTVDCESKTVTISKKALTPTVSASNKTYDGTTSASCSVALSGAITGQSPTASVSTCTFADKNVGTGKKVTGSGITLGSDFTTNYSLNTTSATTTANITAKAITITAKAQTIKYGSSIATGTGQVTVATLASGDSLTSITLTPSTTSVTTSGKITPSAAVIKDSNGSGSAMTSNYSITYTAGTLVITEITPPKVTISVSNGTTYAKSKTATITISDEGGSGVVAGTYTVKYAWGTSAVACSDMTSSTTITVDENSNSDAIVLSYANVSISSGTGAGKIYVCNPTAISDNQGNTLSASTVVSADMYLDNKGPTVTNITTSTSAANVTITVAGASDVNAGMHASTPYYYATSTNSSTCSGATYTSSSNSSYTFTGLDRGSTHYFCVRVYDKLSNYTTYTSSDYSNLSVSLTYPAVTLLSNIEITDGSSIPTNYNYTGGGQTFTTPANASYLLRTWGASGGSADSSAYSGSHSLASFSYNGGFGGYSTGIYNASANTNMYIHVGGAGAAIYSHVACEYNQSGGYNGGGRGAAGAHNGSSYTNCTNYSSCNGNASYYYCPYTFVGTGGGATHIAVGSSDLGVLANYENNQDDVLIVAGGGGGSATQYTVNAGVIDIDYGGDGGGYIGNNGYDWHYSGIGGKQFSDYSNTGSYVSGGYENGVCISSNTNCIGSTIFGQGSGAIQGSTHYSGGGGGGGWFGGGGGQQSGTSIGSGGGGSGYINTNKLINAYMYGKGLQYTSDESSTKTYTTSNYSGYAVPNVTKSGNGYAIITTDVGDSNNPHVYYVNNIYYKVAASSTNMPSFTVSQNLLDNTSLVCDGATATIDETDMKTITLSNFSDTSDEAVVCKLYHNYVSDGLIVSYEGINNEGAQHSNLNSTGWTNLAGTNYNGTIYGSSSNIYWYYDNYLWNDGYTSGSGVLIENSADLLTDGTDFTIEANASPFIPIGTSTSDQVIIGHAQSGGYDFGLNYNGKVFFEIYSSSYGYVKLYSQTTLTRYSFHLLSATWKQDTNPDDTIIGEMCIYINGAKDNCLSWDSSTYGSPDFTPDNSTLWAISCDPNGSACGSSMAFYGYVRSARIYNRALSESEIAYNYSVDNSKKWQ